MEWNAPLPSRSILTIPATDPWIHLSRRRFGYRIPRCSTESLSSLPEPPVGLAVGPENVLKPINGSNRTVCIKASGGAVPSGASGNRGSGEIFALTNCSSPGEDVLGRYGGPAGDLWISLSIAKGSTLLTSRKILPKRIQHRLNPKDPNLDYFCIKSPWFSQKSSFLEHLLNPQRIPNGPPSVPKRPTDLDFPSLHYPPTSECPKGALSVPTSSPATMPSALQPLHPPWTVAKTGRMDERRLDGGKAV